MEVLSTNVSEFVTGFGLLLILGIAFLLFGGIAIALNSFYEDIWAGVLLGLTMAVFAVMLIASPPDFASGTKVTYTVLVTDIDEVYEQGYEVVNQNGKLFTVREVENE